MYGHLRIVWIFGLLVLAVATQNINQNDLFSKCNCDCCTAPPKPQTECQKDIVFLVDTSACLRPSYDRINRAQLEIVQAVADKFGFGSDGSARIALMLDSYCYPRSETCDSTVLMPFGFDSFTSSRPDTITDDIMAAFKKSKNMYIKDRHVLDNALEDAFAYFMNSRNKENTARHLVFIGNGNTKRYRNWQLNIETAVKNLRSIGVKIWPITPMSCPEGRSDLCPNARIQAMLRDPEVNNSMYINGHDAVEALNSAFKEQLMEGFECDAPTDACGTTCKCDCPISAPAPQECGPGCGVVGPPGLPGPEGQSATCSCEDGVAGNPGRAAPPGESGRAGEPGVAGTCPYRRCSPVVDFGRIEKMIEDEYQKVINSGVCDYDHCNL